MGERSVPWCDEMTDAQDRTHAERAEDGRRVPAVQRALEGRIANSILRILLRSPLHALVSRWLVLVSYDGRRTGRRYTFPVVYHQRPDDVTVVTPRGESVWWTNFRTPRRCTLHLRGTERPAVGEVVTDDERGRLLVDYLATHPIVGRMLGVGADAWRSGDRFERATDDLAVVRFSLVDGSGSGEGADGS